MTRQTKCLSTLDAIRDGALGVYELKISDPSHDVLIYSLDVLLHGEDLVGIRQLSNPLFQALDDMGYIV
ncbi:hypothetical protein AVP43_02813 [Geobacillus stearothermophilus]|nr:hypothetical protein AVP43_02813 [Geobacillus stearothermophilus]